MDEQPTYMLLPMLAALGFCSGMQMFAGEAITVSLALGEQVEDEEMVPTQPDENATSLLDGALVRRLSMYHEREPDL